MNSSLLNIIFDVENWKHKLPEVGVFAKEVFETALNFLSKNDLGFEVREGNILILVNGKFTLDMAEEVRRRNALRERMDRLKRNRVFR